MKRRNFVIGAGALATGSAAALGTGAFSSVEAERSVSVEVADDANAYLALESDSDYAQEDGDGVLELDFGQDLGEDLGEHVGEDSRYFFGSGDSENNVFSVTNQGDQEVEITPAWQIFRFDSDGEPVEEDGELIITIQENNTRLSDDPEDGIVRSPGEGADYWARVITGDDPPDSVTVSFEINANEV